ncbi:MULTISPECIES: phenylalanine--tRNA ligase subunit alpha [unclassified Mycoplasma]|uniref:phenylalanine--tRNA ligase subunit alpha n=1 Tax=unclassified Mycoplasma TaxID=2683645 RepID=UPI00216B1287|nr:MULTISPECIES: phenylalanine--tRNA ligase subunit alpha [unclassified Mycoplasma]MCS4537207.1 phenylalanine--tRNA ligase subunit alpha [Mycoplasma sp. CSL7475-4]MCT4469719.1 phenylalanine--tRNA ligase subunit alpha [Mycoplasma sp. HS2188]
MNINFDEINTLEELKIAKSKIYSKDGEIFKLQLQLKSAPVEEKKIIGQQINKLKTEYENQFEKAEKRIEELRIQKIVDSSRIDVSEPLLASGSLHPITIIENRLRDWFIQNGYFESKAGEIVSDYYNFEKLNIPPDHPARAMQDSLYLNATTLLRTHNTGISAVELEKNVNKTMNNFAIGKVYRNDEDDATHSHQFTQLDFVSVGNVSFPNLIWTLKSLLSYVFEEEVELRLRPSFFPFTEPSVEVDIFYKGKWIEVLGAGMLHPNVMNLAGYDSKKFNAFAAGIGIERLAMIKYEIKDIREFYNNDLRTLNQFNGE